MFYYRRAETGESIRTARHYSFWESSMILTRWAAACTLVLVILAGCQKTNKDSDAAAPIPTSEEQIAAAKARYAAMPGVVVGQVEATNGNLTAVTGLDPKAITNKDVLSFIDVPSDEVISHGTLVEAKPSSLIIQFDTEGKRPPKKGDLCVKLVK